jgi:hypoxanthine phosphoribosyltransferase
MKKIYLSWQDVENHTQEIVHQIHKNGWLPDYVVGLTRGGLVPANLISQYLDVPMHTLKVSLRDDAAHDCESNLWMAADAFDGQNILIVDDINDTGATLDWIHDDWSSSCSQDHERWKTIWGESVRVAVLVDNDTSHTTMPISYYSMDINKEADPCWIVFPWEDWWKR